VLGTGHAAKNSPRPATPGRSPRAGLPITPNQCADSELDPWGSVMWKPWLKSTTPPRKGVAPRWIRAKSNLRGPRSGLVTQHQPQHQATAFQASSNNYRLPDAADGSFSNPEPPPDALRRPV